MRTMIVALVCTMAIPAMAQEWYKGGTLHDATALEWSVGSQQDQLATSADWVAVITKRLPTLAEANDLRTCINETDAASLVPNMKVSEVAATCAILMGWYI